MSGFRRGRGRGEGGGGDQEWRFPVRTAAVPPSDDMRWSLTPDLRLSLDAVLEALIPLVDMCRKRCEVTKRAGRVDAFQLMSARICSLSESVTVTFPLVSTMAQELLEMEEQAAAECSGDLLHGNSDAPSRETAYPHPPATPRTATRAHNPNGTSRPLNAGWRYVDGVHQEQEYIKAHLCLAEFNKLRAKEIRLAYVCGFRDALGQLLQWARAHLTQEGAISKPQLNKYLAACATNECEGLSQDDGGMPCSPSSRLLEASKLGARVCPLPVPTPTRHDCTRSSPRREWRAADDIDAFSKFAQLWRGKQNALEARRQAGPTLAKDRGSSGASGSSNKGGEASNNGWACTLAGRRFQSTDMMSQTRQELKREQRGDEEEDCHGDSRGSDDDDGDEENNPFATARKAASAPGGRLWAGGGATGARRLLRQRKAMVMVRGDQRTPQAFSGSTQATPGTAAFGGSAGSNCSGTTVNTTMSASTSLIPRDAPATLSQPSCVAPTPSLSQVATQPMWGKPLLRVTRTTFPASATSAGNRGVDYTQPSPAPQGGAQRDVTCSRDGGEAGETGETGGGGGGGHDMQL